jgi:uncharacterized protein YcbK (DUF882 family)
MIKGRRDILKLSAAAMASLMAPSVMARAVDAGSGERKIKLYNLHTGERANATYWAEGEYIVDELAIVDRVLRDYRTGEVKQMDPRLLDYLYRLQNKVSTQGAFHVISGYRSPKTNSRLASKSQGVAKRSLHMQGRAIDIRLPGVALKDLRQAALKMRAGGVGYYPRSDFIHIDTGRTRKW